MPDKKQGKEAMLTLAGDLRRQLIMITEMA